MAKIILSICIPTYNRDQIISRNLKHLINCPNENIEFIISDDGSLDKTEEFVKNFKDTRIKYNRNKNNLGFDSNLLKCIEIASGDFVFICSDEDYIKLETIPWIIKLIKNNPKVSQIIGKVVDKSSGWVYIDSKDKVLKAGHESLIEYFYLHSYVTGIILKRKALDIKKAKKYIGCVYMHMYLMAQAMLHGDTIFTSKKFCFLGEPDKNLTYIYMKKEDFKNKEKVSIYNPLSRVYQLIYRLRLIYDITSNLPETQKILIKKLRASAGRLISRTFYKSLWTSIQILPYIMRIWKISLSFRFWRTIPKQTLIKFLELLKNKEDLRRFLEQLIHPNHTIIVVG